MWRQRDTQAEIGQGGAELPTSGRGAGVVVPTLHERQGVSLAQDGELEPGTPSHATAAQAVFSASVPEGTGRQRESVPVSACAADRGEGGFPESC